MRKGPRVALISDSHFDSSPGGRFVECCAVHDWIAEQIAERDCDLILHGGDVFERRSTAEERLAVFMWFQRLAQIAPVVVVKGNHDRDKELAALRALDTLFEIIVEEQCGVHEVGGCVVGALAWPSRSGVLTMAGTRATAEAAAGDALRDVLRGLGHEMGELAHADVPRILLAHAMVRGSTTSTGQPLVGCDFEIGFDELAATGADLVALGHIHKGQSWTHDERPVVYPGSPRRTAFGEVEPKGFALIDFDADCVPTWEIIETPCAAMHLVDGEWCDEQLEWRDELPEDVSGAEIRLRYSVAADERSVAALAAEHARENLVRRGAAVVKVEAVVQTTAQARAPEIAAARTLEDKLRALWQVRGDTFTVQRARELLSKARDLQGDTTT
jgi:exonuclease SbcD